MPTRFSFLASRLSQTVLVLWVVATLLFLIFRLMPGNPLVAYIDPNFTAEVQQALLRQFGLDQPLHVQYAVFLSNLVRGEFGRSFFSREPVSQVMWQVLPNTLVLTLSALLLAYAVGVVGGALLAARRGTWAEAWGIPAVLATRAALECWVGMLALARARPDAGARCGGQRLPCGPGGVLPHRRRHDRHDVCVRSAVLAAGPAGEP